MVSLQCTYIYLFFIFFWTTHWTNIKNNRNFQFREGLRRRIVDSPDCFFFFNPLGATGSLAYHTWRCRVQTDGGVPSHFKTSSLCSDWKPQYTKSVFTAAMPILTHEPSVWCLRASALLQSLLLTGSHVMWFECEIDSLTRPLQTKEMTLCKTILFRR